MISSRSPAPLPSRVLLQCAATSGVGTLVGVLLAMAIRFLSSENLSTPLTDLVLQQVLFFGAWGAFVVPLWYVVDRVRRLPSVAAKSLAFAVAGVASWLLHSSFLFFAISALTTGTSTEKTFRAYVFTTIYFESIVFVAVISVIVGMQNRRDAVAQERRATSLALQLSRAQLRALEAQLRPHFLFNALNSVAMLARAGETARIVEMTAKLGEMLRVMLDDDGEVETSVQEELAIVNHYLSIELIRFSDRLQVVIAAEPETLHAFLPRLILQPIIENAIVHGISRNPAGGRIEVKTYRDRNSLVVIVSDDGPGTAGGAHTAYDNGRPRSVGLGLRLTRERLASLYGDTGSLAVHHGTAGTVATIEVPWRERSAVALASK